MVLAYKQPDPTMTIWIYKWGRTVDLEQRIMHINFESVNKLCYLSFSTDLISL